MKTYTLEEWRQKLKTLYGTEHEKYAFKCPACGNVSTVADFIAVGLSKEDALNIAYQECIGRHTGAGSPKEGKTPCNWAAYGLFGTLGKGVNVVNKEGKEIEVFDFAE